MDLTWTGLYDPASFIFVAVLLTGLSGFPGLLPGMRVGFGQRTAARLAVTGSILGLAGSLDFLIGSKTAVYTLAWTLPFDACEVVIDPLSALFLLPVFFISGCTAFYAGSYWPAAANRRTEPLLTCSLGLLAGGMALVTIAGNGVLFLMAWEVMAIAAGLALTIDHHRDEVRNAGRVYLAATHTGTLALLLLFALLRWTTGSFLFPAGGALNGATVPATVMFLCAFIGFGAKAGLMPFHIWLPSAHANAPSHISAIMSGVMLKIGLYGIIRVISLFHGTPLWWGWLLLGVGGASALLGIIFAVAQNDLKRLLAYSSIENVGIIAMGLGTALIGQATNRPLLGLLGLSGALLHMLNHSLFKPLLFLGAGSLIHATGTRMIDLMGGLIRRMPWTAACFLTGVIAICGLPPLNGFAGEFLLYNAFFNDAVSSSAPFLALAAPLLALIGGLAMLCFIKLYGIALLGAPRSAAAAEGHEADWRMLAPMGVLALFCIIFGLFPQALLGLLLPAVTLIAPGLAAARGGLAGSAPLQWLTIAGAALLALIALSAWFLRYRIGAAPLAAGSTWGCGYLRPAPGMQYTASSFSEMAAKLFATAVSQRFDTPRSAGLFPARGMFRSRFPEGLLEQIIMPAFRGVSYLFSYCRRLQHGEHQLYVLYIFVTLLLLMVWAH